MKKSYYIAGIIILAILAYFLFLNNPKTNKQVLLETSLGNITLEMFDSTMPITTSNFEKLISRGFYNGIIFHRVIPNFMIQSGDPQGTGRGGPGYTIQDEFTENNSNDRGTISMANAGPDTGGSQFFINIVNNNYLDSKHPVFGRVIKGMEVVEAISSVPRDKNDKPLQEIKIISATII